MRASGRNSRSIFNNRTGLCTYAALFGIINGGDGRLLKWMKNYYIGNDVKNWQNFVKVRKNGYSSKDR